MMPKGVEHCSGTVNVVPSSHVIPSMMPKGVEHQIYEDEVMQEVASCVSFHDAERR